MWDVLVRAIGDHLVLWLVLMPAAGAIAMSFSRRSAHRMLRVNLSLSGLLCLWLIAAYDPLKPASSREQASFIGPIQQFQFRDGFNWIGAPREQMLEQTRQDGERHATNVSIRWGPDIRFEVGIDGISLWFVVLSVLLVAVAVLRDDAGPLIPDSANCVPSCAAWLWLEASLIGAFVALDVVLFVVGWLSSLTAVAYLLGQRGDSARHEVTPQFLKTQWLSGCLISLGLCGIVLAFGWLRESPRRMETPLVFAAPELVAGIRHWTTGGVGVYLWSHISPWFFGLLIVGFTWPLFLAPFHRGFVAAVVSAPASLAIVLVGVFVKLGVYGWLRFVLPVFPQLAQEHGDWMTTMAAASSLFAAWLAIGQSEWRKRIAFATCSSVGLSLTALLTQTLEGLSGGVLRVLSHGITVALLLFVLPSSSSTNGDRTQNESAKTGNRAVLRFALFAWIGMPGLSGFVSEFLTPFGLIQHDFNAAMLSLATSGLIAWMWVRAERESPTAVAKWSTSDWAVICGLISLNVAMGLWPQFIVDRLEPSLFSLLPIDSGSPAIAP